MSEDINHITSSEELSMSVSFIPSWIQMILQNLVFGLKFVSLCFFSSSFFWIAVTLFLEHSASHQSDNSHYQYNELLDLLPFSWIGHELWLLYFSSSRYFRTRSHLPWNCPKFNLQCWDMFAVFQYTAARAVSPSSSQHPYHYSCINNFCPVTILRIIYFL